MVRLKPWQWVVLALPIAIIIIFLLVSAGRQIHEWGINWIWGVFTLVLVGWRWLLVKWTQPAVNQLEAALAEVNQELESASDETTVQLKGTDTASKAQSALQDILSASRSDPPVWEDWSIFWKRCQEVVVAIAYVSTFTFPKLTD